MGYIACRITRSSEFGEGTEVVKQLDATKRSLKETIMGRRSYSPPISAKKTSSFIFQPLDEYLTYSKVSSMDVHDVWRPPNWDTSNRRSVRAVLGDTRKENQDGVWAHSSTTKGRATDCGGKTGASSRVNLGVRASTIGKRELVQ